MSAYGTFLTLGDILSFIPEAFDEPHRPCVKMTAFRTKDRAEGMGFLQRSLWHTLPYAFLLCLCCFHCQWTNTLEKESNRPVLLTANPHMWALWPGRGCWVPRVTNPEALGVRGHWLRASFQDVFFSLACGSSHSLPWRKPSTCIPYTSVLQTSLLIQVDSEEKSSFLPVW